jgi:uncharacterized membrane protein YkoI
MHIKLVASSVIAALLMTGTAAAVSPASGQGAQLQPTTVAAATPITEAEAIAAALDHAKLTEAETENLRIRMDRDDRRDHWEVQWRSGDVEYDYDIDPDTGAVLDWDRDFEPQRKSAPAAQTPSPTQPTQPAAPAAQLSEDEALAIALDHAGFTAGEVTNLRIRLDTDDRTPDYEIEFRRGQLEYEYEIHAETGAIKDFDRDD